MTERRTADPTLLERAQEWPVVIYLNAFDGAPPTAHRFEGASRHQGLTDSWDLDAYPAPCGARPPDGNAWADALTLYAAWFAVPCRTCFPDAPPPGSRSVEEQAIYPDDLAWQLPDTATVNVTGVPQTVTGHQTQTVRPHEE